MGGPMEQDEATAFLRSHLGEVDDVTPMGGGDWSQAYSFRHGSADLVARFGVHRDDFEADRAAMAHDGPDLPVPRVLVVVQARGGWCAISERGRGVFLEEVDASLAAALIPALCRALDALRALPVPASVGLGWRAWLAASLVDHADRRTSGWRAMIAGRPKVEAVWHQAQARFEALLPMCPEIRHVLHRDLLHRNVLVSPEGARLTAVFDWGCSIIGDPLYELAWFAYFEPWHPGHAGAEVAAALTAHLAAVPELAVAFAERVRCYTLQIGLEHVAYSAWAGREADLQANLARTAALVKAPLSAALQRGR